MSYKKQDILNGVLITDVAESFKIKLETVSSGNFTHRCKCPSKDHKNGGERTCSLYIDSNNNNFYCFGCSASSNVIDFYIACSGGDFLDAINNLGPMIKEGSAKASSSLSKKSNFGILVDMSKFFKNLQKENPNDILWIEQVMKKTDNFLLEIDMYDLKRTRELFNKVKILSKRRYR